jgi:hypothetical protein
MKATPKAFAIKLAVVETKFNVLATIPGRESVSR